MNQTCDRCGAPMIPLLTSWACKAECDLAPKLEARNTWAPFQELEEAFLEDRRRYDFGDGRGMVAAHQHPNGLGWVADTATVALTAYVGPNAKVFQNARVIDSAQILDNSRVFGSAVVGGRVRVIAESRVSGSVHLQGDMTFSTGHLVGKVSDFLRRLEQQQAHKELEL